MAAPRGISRILHSWRRHEWINPILTTIAGSHSRCSPSPRHSLSCFISSPVDCLRSSQDTLALSLGQKPHPPSAASFPSSSSLCSPPHLPSPSLSCHVYGNVRSSYARLESGVPCGASRCRGETGYCSFSSITAIKQVAVEESSKFVHPQSSSRPLRSLRQSSPALLISNDVAGHAGISSTFSSFAAGAKLQAEASSLSSGHSSSDVSQMHDEEEELEPGGSGLNAGGGCLDRDLDADSVLDPDFDRKESKRKKGGVDDAAEIGYSLIGKVDGDGVLPFSVKPQELFAIVQIGAHQFKVTPGDVIYTEKLKIADINDKLALEKVLLLGSKSRTIIGRPTVPDAFVKAAVEEQALDAKVIVFKKKRRKNYRRTRGHRQMLTRLRILEVVGVEEDGLPDHMSREASEPRRSMASEAAVSM